MAASDLARSSFGSFDDDYVDPFNLQMPAKSDVGLFGRLAGELRIQIYDYILITNTTVLCERLTFSDVSTVITQGRYLARLSGLARTCKQFRSEMSGHFHKQCDMLHIPLSLHLPLCIPDFDRKLPELGRNLTRVHIRVRFVLTEEARGQGIDETYAGNMISINIDEIVRTLKRRLRSVKKLTISIEFSKCLSIKQKAFCSMLNGCPDMLMFMLESLPELLEYGISMDCGAAIAQSKQADGNWPQIHLGTFFANQQKYNLDHCQELFESMGAAIVMG